MELFINLEPYIVCFEAVIHSFIEEVYHYFKSPSDGGTVWEENTWFNNYKKSLFKLHKVYRGIFEEESKVLYYKIFRNTLYRRFIWLGQNICVKS